MKQLQILLLALGALVSAIPGYGSIQEGVGAPPDYGPLFGGVQIALSTLMLLVILLYRAEIARMSRRRLIYIAAGCVSIFFMSLSSYTMLLDLCTVHVLHESPPHKKRDIFFPIWPEGELAKAIEQTSRQDVANEMPRGLDDILEKQNVPLAVTTVVLLLLYVVTFVSLVSAFALMSIRIEAQ